MSVGGDEGVGAVVGVTQQGVGERSSGSGTKPHKLCKLCIINVQNHKEFHNM